MKMSGQILTGSYDAWMIALSVLISIFASYAALDLGGRVTSAKGRAQALWLAGGATAMGVGIWAMHYVGMLAFKLPMEVLYDWPTVALSLLAAILASAIALFVTSRKTMGTASAIAGSLFMGGGIASMHYIGMAAMRFPAMCQYSPWIVAISVAIAIVISLVALLLTFRFRDGSSGGWPKFASALLMGAAIPAMHYTGMAAARFYASNTFDGNLRHAIDITSLGAAGIVVVTFMVLGLTIFTSQIDRRFSAQARKLELSERKSQQILETSRDAFVGIDANGLITDWSAQAEKTFGWPRESAAGRSFSDLVVLNSCRDSYAANLRELMQQPSGHERNHRFDTRVVRSDGKELPAEITISTVEIDQGICFAAFIRDLTERERAERKFSGLLEASSEAILFVTASGQIVVANSRAQELFGYSKEELLGQELSILLPERLRAKHETHHASFFERPAARSMGQGREFLGRRKDGSEFLAEISLNPLEAEEGIVVSTVILDITARKEKERALEQAHVELRAVLAQAEERAQQSTRLAELLEILQSCQTTDEAYRVVRENLPYALPTSSGALCLTTSSRNIVENLTSWGPSVATETVFRPEDCWALRRGKVQNALSLEGSLRCSHVHEFPPGGHICVPLIGQGETLGILYLERFAPTDGESTEFAAAKTKTLIRQAIAVGEGLSLALANLKLRDMLRTQSIRDPLTGLFNRRYMEETLERELKRCQRNNEPLSVLMLDIDHFKRFNDTFGHQAGDALLRGMGDLLSHRTRGQDVACRYGGEEFCVILVGAPMQGARTKADSLREDVRKLSIQYAGQLLGTSTISVGVSSFPEYGTSQELIRAADIALYRAKEGGRDRVVAGDSALLVNPDPRLSTR
jgi:diguanylate cyclase (GGDEF)-like protein/PAS domain S-box-containing protein